MKEDFGQRAILKEELEKLKERIIMHHRQAGQVASGRTISSMNVVVNNEGGTLFGRKAFGVLETGRRGGKVPQSFEEIIKQWIIDKGIKPTPIPYVRKPSSKWKPKYSATERGLFSLAGAIAHKIRMEGTKLYRKGGRNDIYSQEIPIAIDLIHDRIARIFATEIEHIMIN